MAKRSIPRDARRAKVLTLADVRVTHTLGGCPRTVRGAELAQLIDATRHLHDQDEPSDFIDATSISIELRGVADVLLELSTGNRAAALSYLSDQLRRLATRTAAIAPRSGNDAPDQYTVEVKK